MTKNVEEEGLASVIIPTMGQANHLLGPLLAMYNAHPRVGEVLVINNSGVAQPLIGAKTREIHRGENIFVNPAWNLGAQEAKYPFLIISNDDIAISARMVAFALRVAAGPVGIVGPSSSCVRHSRDRLPWVAPAYDRRTLFGTFMVMRRENYKPIPDDLKVFAGDDYLFGLQEQRNVFLGGFAVRTPMGVTSRQPQYSPIKLSDVDTFNAKYRFDMTYYARFAREVQIFRGGWALARKVLRRS